eukprot:5837034-Prymnesium_polylepis.1
MDGRVRGGRRRRACSTAGVPRRCVSAGKAAAMTALETHWKAEATATPVERTGVGKSSEARMLGTGPSDTPKQTPKAVTAATAPVGESR